MLIFLIGYMGSGKTTLGRPLASRLGYRFTDLDKAIEDGEERTIGEIFSTDGEAYFRDLERKYLQKIVDEGGDWVISTGGGTPCFGENMALMNASGVTVYLKIAPRMLADRLLAAKVCRPLVAGKTPDELLSYIEETLAVREKFYGQANVIVSNPSRDVTKLVQILEPYLSVK
ncbi:shikimate kinase [Millionella massiliensis]|uniref:shikimate kinase n=2 Tax=Millionella massiliensis TaxID=1871023 RepID=UPI0008DAEA6C|nr:shikimate kinase [Millionella massiliensis]